MDDEDPRAAVVERAAVVADPHAVELVRLHRRERERAAEAVDAEVVQRLALKRGGAAEARVAGGDRVEDPLRAQVAVLDVPDVRVVGPGLVAERLAQADDPAAAGQVGPDEQARPGARRDRRELMARPARVDRPRRERERRAREVRARGGERPPRARPPQAHRDDDREDEGQDRAGRPARGSPRRSAPRRPRTATGGRRRPPRPRERDHHHRQREGAERLGDEVAGDRLQRRVERDARPRGHARPTARRPAPRARTRPRSAPCRRPTAPRRSRPGRGRVSPAPATLRATANRSGVPGGQCSGSFMPFGV